MERCKIMLNIALPKGRLGNKVYELFESIGYDCDEIKSDNRKLIFENSDKKIRFLLVKPSDVAVYVEKGSADIGVVGKDILLEDNPDVYELLDLGFGKCKFGIAGPVNFKENFDRPLVVATKYFNVSKRYFDSINRDVELIKLNGSIEIAPILELSDVIVDIVETGTTLRENHLKVLNFIGDISARLIANKSSYRFNHDKIENIVKKIKNKIDKEKIDKTENKK